MEGWPSTCQRPYIADIGSLYYYVRVHFQLSQCNWLFIFLKWKSENIYTATMLNFKMHIRTGLSNFCNQIYIQMIGLYVSIKVVLPFV